MTISKDQVSELLSCLTHSLASYALLNQTITSAASLKVIILKIHSTIWGNFADSYFLLVQFSFGNRAMRESEKRWEYMFRGFE